MEEENKDKVQSQEMEFDTWDEEQFYAENIVPKVGELVELCESRKIPFVFHIHYSHDGENTGVGTNCACFGKKSLQTAKIGACGAILSNAIGALEMAVLASIATIARKDK